MALGVVGSGIYGMVEAGPHLVNQTVGIVGSVTVSHQLSCCIRLRLWHLPQEHAAATTHHSRFAAKYLKCRTMVLLVDASLTWQCS